VRLNADLCREDGQTAVVTRVELGAYNAGVVGGTLTQVCAVAVTGQRAFLGHDGLHRCPRHDGYRAVGAHDGRNTAPTATSGSGAIRETRVSPERLASVDSIASCLSCPPLSASSSLL
jgi:hypothetical protein